MKFDNTFINQLKKLLDNYNINDHIKENMEVNKKYPNLSLMINYCEHYFIIYFKFEAYIEEYFDSFFIDHYEHQYNFNKNEFEKINDFRDIRWGYNKNKNCYNEKCCKDNWKELRFFQCDDKTFYKEYINNNEYQSCSENVFIDCINYFTINGFNITL